MAITSENQEHTSTGLGHRKLLMWTFLGSECLFFGSLIATHMVNRNEAAFVHGLSPACLLDIPITSLSTFVLLMSSVAMVLAVAAAYRFDVKQQRLWLLMTALLGIVFLGFQAYEFQTFVNEGLTIGTNLFGSTFFTLTGFHGAHVTLGVVWILIMLILSYVKPDATSNPLNTDIAGLYWHFVDIVWIVIFTVVYLIGSYGLDCGHIG
ncbi:uncharacterized protein METZ01_LOCUS93736 [marine metagenome]|uniref:Heme-copper oxidase subunit III family profile domain-containing protein n=1 Tax=marine metagenome TaxID=408172 RepID=A0A381VKQ7_9ZZZZ